MPKALRDAAYYGSIAMKSLKTALISHLCVLSNAGLSSSNRELKIEEAYRIRESN